MTVDVVCGMKVNEETALRYAYQGKTYYFCSPVCKTLFEREPEKYIQQEAQKQGAAEARTNEE